jgi:hypothetical protein
MVTKNTSDPELGRIKVEKLKLNKETVKDLTPNDMQNVRGGWIRPPISWGCPQPPPSSSNCPKQTE